MDALSAKLLASIQDPATIMLVFAVIYLWKELKACKDNHLDCERKNLILAGSVEDLADGNVDDAREKASQIIDGAKKEIAGGK